MKIIKKLSTTNCNLNANNPQYIIIHETDNTAVGAGAERHCSAQANGNIGKASVHYYVDDTGIYQALEHKHASWNCGDGQGKNGIHNKNTISIEICVNPDSDYNKAVDNTIELVRYLKGGYYSYCKVVRHFDASGKKCPRRIIDNNYWNTFLKRVSEGDNNIKPEEDVKPSKPESNKPNNTMGIVKGYNATIVNDFLYTRDSNGNKNGGRIDIGDKIKVLDVSYSKQLIKVEYPVPGTTKIAYATNAVNCIKYLYQDQYKNGSTTEPVYEDAGCKNKIGVLDSYEKSTPLYRRDGKLHVVYTTGKGKDTKSGYVKYSGGFNKF